MAGHDLAQFQRELLTKLGRSSEALAAAWSSYREHPNLYTYNDLMKYVPKAKRAEWHERAIAAAKSADLDSAIELLVETKEMERLAGLIHKASDQALEDLSHYTTEPLARKLEKSRPGLAARLWRAQGLRIVNAKKSKYYGAALSNFKNAKRCFERAGLRGEWQKTVGQVRTDHRRKSGFMEGFERLVAGVGPSDKLSFMEQAKARFRTCPRRAR